MRVTTINRSEYSAWMARGQIGQVLVNEKGPQVEAVSGTDGLHGGVKNLEGAGDVCARGRENDRLNVLCVHVTFDEARLRHPVKKFLEAGKVLGGLVSMGWHLLRSESKRLRKSKEVAA